MSEKNQVTLDWTKPMTSKQAAKYWLTKGFVAKELYDAEIAQLREEVESAYKEGWTDAIDTADSFTSGKEIEDGWNKSDACKALKGAE